MARERVYSRYSRHAVALLGEQIRLGRKQRRWSESNLAERAGISRATLQKMERGDMGCAIGLVFEIAALVGVPLFAQDETYLVRQRERIQDKIALLPAQIRTKDEEVYDDF